MPAYCPSRLVRIIDCPKTITYENMHSQASKYGIQNYDSHCPHLTIYQFRSHSYGLSAHHNGCNGIVRTPRCCIRNETSCRRGSADVIFPPGPLQKSSAEDAARGQIIGSMFEELDCSVQRLCWPVETAVVSLTKASFVGWNSS